MVYTRVLAGLTINPVVPTKGGKLAAAESETTHARAKQASKDALSCVYLVSSTCHRKRRQR